MIQFLSKKIHPFSFLLVVGLTWLTLSHSVIADTRTTTLPSAGGPYSPAINTGPNTQQKSGSLLVGPTGSLCLNDDPLTTADDNVNCVSSWDRFTGIIGDKVSVNIAKLPLTNSLLTTSYTLQNGFIDLVAQSSQSATATITAPTSVFCNVGAGTCYNNPAIQCTKDKDCGFSNTGIYASGGDYSSSAIFNGRLYVKPISTATCIGGSNANNACITSAQCPGVQGNGKPAVCSPAGQLCLGFSQNPVCISSWNDFQYTTTITTGGAYVQRFKTSTQTGSGSETLDTKVLPQDTNLNSSGNGAFLSRHATAGTISVGNAYAGDTTRPPGDPENPPGMNVHYTCGNGICDSGETGNTGSPYICQIDCSPPQVPTLSFRFGTVTQVRMNVAANANQKPTGSYMLLLVRSDDIAFNGPNWANLFVPRNGVTYTGGQRFGSVTIVSSQIRVNNTTTVVVDTVPTPGTYYYRLFQANAYPIYNLVPPTWPGSTDPYCPDSTPLNDPVGCL